MFNDVTDYLIRTPNASLDLGRFQVKAGTLNPGRDKPAEYQPHV